MIDGFSRCGRVFFTELCVNHEVIASTSNVVSGNAGFAFKVGWHPGYAKLAPGLLNELELIRHAPTLCAELAYIDSGAAPGSYVDDLVAGPPLAHVGPVCHHVAGAAGAGRAAAAVSGPTLAADPPGGERSPLMPEVSIILPTYNRADSLRRAIDSVRQQTFTDWELLVVDNGSTERSESYETTSRCNEGMTRE